MPHTPPHPFFSHPVAAQVGAYASDTPGPLVSRDPDKKSGGPNQKNGTQKSEQGTREKKFANFRELEVALLERAKEEREGGDDRLLLVVTFSEFEFRRICRVLRVRPGVEAVLVRDERQVRGQSPRKARVLLMPDYLHGADWRKQHALVRALTVWSQSGGEILRDPRQ